MTDPNVSGLVVGAAGGYFLLIVIFPIFIVGALLVIIFTLLSVSDKLSAVIDHLGALNENTLQEPMTKEEYSKYKSEQVVDDARQKAVSNRLIVITLSVVLGVVVLAFGLVIANLSL